VYKFYAAGLPLSLSAAFFYTKQDSTPFA
jgi:hypothetical protein